MQEIAQSRAHTSIRIIKYVCHAHQIYPILIYILIYVKIVAVPNI